MYQTVLHKWIAVCVTAAFLASLLCSCASGPLPDAQEPGDGVFIRFSILAGNRAKSRAADISGDLPGSIPENYIDIDDIRYLVFDDDLKFILDLTPEATTMVSSDDVAVYDVVAHLTDPYFVEKASEAIPFNILVLANYTGWEISIPPLSKGDDISVLFTGGLVMNVVPETSSLFKAGQNGEQLFPLSGLQKFVIPVGNLLTSSKESPFNVSVASGKDVNLLRALAKIEVIDKINIFEDQVFEEERDNSGYNSYLRISGVKLGGRIDKGTLLPAAERWKGISFFETQQVDAATVPASAAYFPPSPFDDGNYLWNGSEDFCVTLVRDEYASSLREDKCPVFSCYVYEYSQDCTQLKNIAASRLPYFAITTRGRIDSEGNVVDQSVTLPMRMAEYNDGVWGSELKSILRNHIYRFEIAGIGRKMKWTVCPMDSRKAEIIYN